MNPLFNDIMEIGPNAAAEDGADTEFWRSGYNYDRDAASLETGVVCDPEEDKTQQQFAEESDINTIVRRFGLTGEMPSDLRAPVSGDFTGVTDFQTAMNAVRQAEEEFMRMPAEMRYRFSNSPQRLLEFLEDGNNREEAIKLGLIPKPRELTRAGDPVPGVVPGVVPGA